MENANDSYEQKVIAMVGSQLCNDEKDYGKIIDYLIVTQNCARRYVFITDTGRKIDAGSAMRFIQTYRRKINNSPRIVFPDGSDAVMNRRKMRVRRSGMRSLGGTISNLAKVGDETINISSTVTSAGSFPEEYREDYNNGGK